MATSVFYSIIRNFITILDQRGVPFFLPCKLCIFTEHEVVQITILH